MASLVLCLALPVLALRLWSVAAADRLASSVALGLGALLAPASPGLSEPEASGEPEAAPEAPLFSQTARSGARAPRVRGHKPLHAARPPLVQRGVRVSSAQVLALAVARAMPQAVPVKANAEHPAGLLLRGVSALGVGLQDGDVLTEAAGQKARSVAQVVGLVLAARGRQAPEISGRFYRAGVPFGLTVEQPYLKGAVPG